MDGSLFYECYPNVSGGTVNYFMIERIPAYLYSNIVAQGGGVKFSFRN